MISIDYGKSRDGNLINFILRKRILGLYVEILYMSSFSKVNNLFNRQLILKGVIKC